MAVYSRVSSIRRFVKKLTYDMITKRSKENRPFTVIVEGNIGSGKTTFLNYFKKFEDICVLAEPIDSWRNCRGHNLLGFMYSDPQKWSLTFQSYVQLTMLNHHILPTKCPIKMIERSIYSARYCFVEQMMRDGVLSGPSAAVIDSWFQWIVKNTDIKVDHIVYLRTKPEVVYQRMLERNRPEEKPISLEFLKNLHDLHEQWLYDKVLHERPANVSVINANLDLDSIELECRKMNEVTLNPRKIVQ